MRNFLFQIIILFNKLASLVRPKGRTVQDGDRIYERCEFTFKIASLVYLVYYYQPDDI